MRLFVGSQGGTLPSRDCIQKNLMPLFFDRQTFREAENLIGDRCWTLAHRHSFKPGSFNSPDELFAIGDSGAFSHSPSQRWSLEEHIANISKWEKNLAKSQGWEEWFFSTVASYDLLIDEVWVDECRQKQRWSTLEAERAVNETVATAQYLNSQRNTLQPRILLLGCQGVNAAQYRRCVERVLEVATPGDWIGLGGWCILGHLNFKHYLFEFFKVLNECVELVALANIKHIHLFGVRYEPAVAAMQWTCDRYGISCSTDSSRVLLDCRVATSSVLKKSGARESYWRDNVDWWKTHLAHLDRSPYYQRPSDSLARTALQRDAFLGVESRKFLQEKSEDAEIVAKLYSLPLAFF
jgi:hypothetical protein